MADPSSRKQGTPKKTEDPSKKTEIESIYERQKPSISVLYNWIAQCKLERLSCSCRVVVSAAPIAAARVRGSIRKRCSFVCKFGICWYDFNAIKSFQAGV
ncbi:hypothetical protein Tco_1131667 [Tanacetum coccineum]